jgi:hypothetical protein
MMPDFPTEHFIHAQSKENKTWWEKHRDWRGVSGMYRGGYNYVISTMGFNHTATTGALLGGALIGSERVIADGRHGLENVILRFHMWQDGTTSESIDHYYFAISLSGQKMYQDFGPTEYDRLLGRVTLTKSVEELTSSYHPALRRMISPSTRTSTGNLFLHQGGLQSILHTMSRSGALHDIGNTNTFGMPVVGFDFPPKRVVLQSLKTPWGPEWASNTVDEKPIPYVMTTAETALGSMMDSPRYKRTYLGHHYGLTCMDIPGSHPVVPFMAQWRRGERQLETLQELGTLLARYSVNEADLVTTYGAGGRPMLGKMAMMQNKGTTIMLMSPFTENKMFKPEKGVVSLQSTVGLFDFNERPPWVI